MVSTGAAQGQKHSELKGRLAGLASIIGCSPLSLRDTPSSDGSLAPPSVLEGFANGKGLAGSGRSRCLSCMTLGPASLRSALPPVPYSDSSSHSGCCGGERSTAGEMGWMLLWDPACHLQNGSNRARARGGTRRPGHQGKGTVQSPAGNKACQQESDGPTSSLE